MSRYLGSNSRIDHIAIAVNNIDEALFLYEDVFGFELLARRDIQGQFTGMRSAELDAGGFKIVLVQGTDPESQVSRYVEKYGTGVQHVAVEVSDVDFVEKTLASSGIKFATNVIRGKELTQIFTQRDTNSGMMFEFISRSASGAKFEENNILSLFKQLEAAEAY
ncbi:VOC family protein [Teredinibacter purpureus]|uniref:VOC family protein n=1 Tax=Teredinibacter purpureus TaxID=2731756 RepID=UPI0005F84AD3|nr:VOC family protein [Teredinibacter purpureus]